MQVPTWLRLDWFRYANLPERWFSGAVPADGAPATERLLSKPSCGEQQRLGSLRDNGPQGADSPGGNNKWIYVR